MVNWQIFQDVFFTEQKKPNSPLTPDYSDSPAKKKDNNERVNLIILNKTRTFLREETAKFVFHKCYQQWSQYHYDLRF